MTGGIFMICKNCGTNFDGQYCPNCGAKAEPASAPRQSTPPYGAPQNFGNGQSAPPYGAPQNFGDQQNGYVYRPTRKIGFGEAVKLFFKNYVNFNGRATRSEYWWVYLFNIIVYTVLSILFSIAGGASLAGAVIDGDVSIAYMGAGAIFYVLMILYVSPYSFRLCLLWYAGFTI